MGAGSEAVNEYLQNGMLKLGHSSCLQIHPHGHYMIFGERLSTLASEASQSVTVWGIAT